MDTPANFDELRKQRYMREVGTILLGTNSGGGSLLVIHDNGRAQDRPAWLDDASTLNLSKLMVEGARDALWYAIDHLRRYPQLGGNWNEIIDALAWHCFMYAAEDWPPIQPGKRPMQRQIKPAPKLEGRPSFLPRDMDIMRRVLIKTLNGILGNQTVVIEDLSGMSAAGATGMVKDKKEIKKIQDEGNKPKFTRVREAGQSQPNYWLAGNVRIDWKTLRELSQWYPAVQVYIHEATHKHAGTADAFYIHSMKMLDDTSVAASYQSGKKSPEQSLKNADSYAWFAYTLWKRLRNLAKTQGLAISSDDKELRKVQVGQ